MFYVASEETYHDGDIIIEEGSSGDWVYVVQSGTVEISKTIKGKKFIVTMLGPGEIFGELGFLGGLARTATARAIGETTVGVIDRAFLDKEFNKLSADFRAILAEVVKRFKQMSDRTIELSSRRENRAQKTLSLAFEDRQSFSDGYTQNVGEGGLFIQTENPLERGEQFLLKLQLPDLLSPMEIKCEVVWTRKQQEEKEYPNGMGVKFVEITKGDNQALKQYLNP
jgi:CRP/FNR family cyclic AMP-dependent transcriptional regulator